MDRKYEPDHVDDEWFEQYVMGTLPEEQAALLETRLLVDEECRRKLDETEAYIMAMRGALRRAQREPSHGPRHWAAWLARPFPMAIAGSAGVLTIVFIVGALRYRENVALGPITQTVALTAERGMASNAEARAGHLQLRLDLRGIAERGEHSVKLVTEEGHEVWSAPLKFTGDFTPVDVRRQLAPGDYLVRIHAGPEQLREFHLAVL